jgi:uncharacterized heparinase superfamily protein
MRLGDAAPDRIGRWGNDPRVGDTERGREIGRGIWRIGAERLQGDHLFPWLPSHPSRHFTARLHSFSWLVDLAAVGPSAHGFIAQLIDAWVKEHGEWDDLAWDPEITAERLFAWLCWGRPAFEQGAPEQRASLLRSAARQARLLLMAQSELSERHLGSIKAGAALVLAGAADFPEGERFAEQGEEMLIEACAKQFYGDGGHLSRSPEALAEALCDLVTARDALDDPPQILTDYAAQARQHAAHVASGRRPPRLLPRRRRRFSRDHRRRARARQRRHPPLPIRQSHRLSALDVGGLRALFDVGGAPPLNYAERAHASALSFELSSDTERLIVNIGATRELSPAARMAARATNAHSTLVLADALSANLDERRGGSRLTGPNLDEVRRSSDESGITVQGRHDGYKEKYGLWHRRYIFVDHEGKNLRGIDELIRPMKLKSPNPKNDIPYVVRFHLHPNVRVRISEHQTALLETPGGQRWRLRTDAPNIAIEPSIYWGGEIPRESHQITLSGEADPMGHGLAPPNRIRWALAQS